VQEQVQFGRAGPDFFTREGFDAHV
jgi:hypothetical protein